MYTQFEMPDSNGPIAGNEMICLLSHMYVDMTLFIYMYKYIHIYICVCVYTHPDMAADAEVQYLLVG